MDPLQAFREIYNEVPDWVVAMHETVPDALRHYTELRTTVMKNGALSRKEKELILIGVNAARRYETSLLYHVKGAMDAGATSSEVADTVLTAVISRGLPAWLEGQKAVTFALDYEAQRGENTDPQRELSLQPPLLTIEDCDAYCVSTFGGIPEWALKMRDFQPDVLVSYMNLRKGTLRDNQIPAKLKELVLVAINAAERYELGVAIHTKGAFAQGVTKAELAECLLTAVLTAGIPAWFTGYDFLG